ncbi:hypothetical protein J3F83DRAFT_736009 [Trichoderma novae-zelandiae]
MKPTGGSQRAAEITSAMLSVPGYADDTMLFMMRYGAKAQHSPGNQETLRKVDWDEFQVRVSALNTHWFASRSSSSSSSAYRGTAGDGETSCTTTTAGDGTTAAAATTSTIINTAAATSTAAAAAAATADDNADSGAAPDEASRAAELRARTLELVAEFPLLVRDFDRFVDCTRIMATRYGRRPQEQQ